MKQYNTLTGEDEMSLNSSLQTLGQLMATNLQSKGVTANASDGLTTLANKILQVGPTQIEYNLELTSDKNTLSFYDHEYCVLTATLLDSNGNGVSGEEIVFKANGGLLNTVITGDNGVATVSYNSQGVGDVTITAECMNLTKTYTLEDCNYYSKTGTTLIQNDSTDSDYPSDIPYHHEGTEKYMVEFDFTMKTSFRFYYANTELTSKGDPLHYGYGFSRDASGRFVISTRTTTTSNSTYTTGLANGEERRIKMIIDGTTVSFYDNGNLIRTQTNEWLTTNPPAYFSWATWGTGTVTVKNIKIKPL